MTSMRRVESVRLSDIHLLTLNIQCAPPGPLGPLGERNLALARWLGLSHYNFCLFC